MINTPFGVEVSLKLLCNYTNKTPTLYALIITTHSYVRILMSAAAPGTPPIALLPFSGHIGFQAAHARCCSPILVTVRAISSRLYKHNGKDSCNSLFI